MEAREIDNARTWMRASTVFRPVLERGLVAGQKSCPALEPADVDFRALRRLYANDGLNLGARPVKYLCMVYLEKGTTDSLSKREHAELDRRNIAYADELRESGHCLITHALQPTSTATTVRLRGGRVSMTDGPFAETKEHLGGFILIEARDLNEAVQIAARCPLAELGSLEVRPILEIDDRPLAQFERSKA
jgi:hypothetical protein